MKKLMKKVLIILVLAILFLGSCGEILSYAYKITTQTIRDNGNVFQIDTPWKKKEDFVQFKVDGDDSFDYYCLKGNTKIGSGSYDKNNDLNAFTSVSDYEDKAKSVLRDGVTFGSYTLTGKDKSLKAIQWLARNMYCVTSEQKTLMQDNINYYINKYCDSSDGTKSCTLGTYIKDEEVINIIQQHVLWKFVNPTPSIYGDTEGIENYYQNYINSAEDIKKICKNGSYITSDNVAKEGFALYKALCRAAIKFANGETADDLSLAQFNNFKASIPTTYKSDDDYKKIIAVQESQTGQCTYKTGKFRIVAKNIDSVDITLSGISQNIKSWTLYDEDGNILISSSSNNDGKAAFVKKVNNGNIEGYLQFKTSSKIVSDASISIKFEYQHKISLGYYSARVYSKDSNSQPILGIKKSLNQSGNSSSVKFTYNYENPDLDLALVKNIDSVFRCNNYTNSYERIYYERDTNEINNKNYRYIRRIDGDYTTRQYIMNKEAMVVKPGDIIRYRFRIFNEGDTTGYIKEISDYLPKGIKLLNVSTTNTSGLTATDYLYYTVKNKSTFDISSIGYDNYTIVKIRYKDDDGKSIKNTSEVNDPDIVSIYLECQVEETAETGKNLINIAAITDYGYKNEFGNYTKAEIVEKVDRDSSVNVIGYNNYVSNILENINSIKNDGKDIKEIDKGEIVDEDDEDFEQVKVGEFDLALRKYISQVTDSNGKITIYNREPYISMNSVNQLINKTRTTLAYDHMKNPIEVKNGDTVLYTIRVYNEGDIAGEVYNIRDYLPAGLKLKPNSTINDNVYKWYETNDGYIRTTLSKIINPAKGEEGLKKVANKEANNISSEDKFWEDYQVECIVDAEGIENGAVLTNFAEISSYGYKYGTIDNKGNAVSKIKYCNKDGVDRDSKLNNVLNGLENNGFDTDTNGYYNYQENGNSQRWKYQTEFEGIEDDDDFENVVVKNDSFDLALRKYIKEIKRNGNSVGFTTRVPNVDRSTIKADGTATYHHSKQPITVKKGDIITYGIRVYNEGYKNGRVTEITDYLPKGLKYLTNSQNNQSYNWTATEKSDGTTVLKSHKQLDIDASNRYDLVNTNGDNLNNFYKEILVDCEVTSNMDNDILTNVAEISEYGWIRSSDSQYIKAETKNIDSDSEFGGSGKAINSSNNIKSEIASYYAERGVDEYETKTAYTGRQDDDDFESVKVEAKYTKTVTIEKVDEDGNKLSGAYFEIAMTSGTIGKSSIDANQIGTRNYEGLNVDKTGTKYYNDLIAYKNYYFSIKEILSPTNYNNVLDGYTIIVPTYINEQEQLKIGCTNFNDYNDKFIIIDNSTNSKVLETNSIYNKVQVKVVNNNLKIIVENPKIDGGYRFQIKKVDKNNPTKGIPNMQFNVKISDADDEDITPLQKVMKTSDIEQYLGQITSSYIEIKGEGKDKIEITEVIDDSNNYIELKDPLTVYVTRGIEDGKYKATAVSFEKDKIVTELKDVPLSNNTSNVTVNAEIVEDIVRVIIPNEKITGSYGLQIVKQDKKNANTRLEGVQFKVAVEGETIKDEQNNDKIFETDGQNGRAIVLRKADNLITEENVNNIDIYTITETSVGDNAYKKLKENINLYVQKELSSDGNSYVVKRYSLEPIEEEKEDVHETENVILDFKSDGIMYVRVKNEAITGKYTVKIRKEKNDGKNTPISNVKFSVTKNNTPVSTSPEVTNSMGRVQVISNNTITSKTVDDVDKFSITEIDLNGKGYRKITVPLDIYVHKDIEDEKYVVKTISFKKTAQGDTKITKPVSLKNNSSKKVTVTAEIQNDLVLITIPNEEIIDKYNLEVVKTKEDKQTRITEASFTVAKTEGTNETILLKEASVNNNGSVTTGDIELNQSNITRRVSNNTELNQNNINSKDVFEIEEVSVNNKYLGLKDLLCVYVDKIYKVDEEKYEIDASFDETDMTKKTKEVTLADEKTKLFVDLNVDNVTKKITVTVPNKEIQGSYRLQIRKKDSKTNEGIGNIKFNADITPKVGNVVGTVINKTMTTSSKQEYLGQITSKNIPIEGQGKDEIIITEVIDNTNKYIELQDPITIYVTKEIVGGVYKATAVSFEKNSVVTELNNVPLNNGSSKVTLNAEIEGDIVRVIIPNEEIQGSYGLKIEKQGENEQTKLNGVSFEVKSNNSNVSEETYTTAAGGIATILDKNNNTFTEEGTDIFDIYEKSVGDNAYLKNDDTFSVYVKKTINGNEYKIRYSLDQDTFKNTDENVDKHSSDDGVINLSMQDGLITVKVKNNPITGKYQFKVKKIDNKNKPIEGVKFKVSKKVNNNQAELQTYSSETSDLTNSAGKIVVKGNNDSINIKEKSNTITKDNVNYIDEFTVSEINLNDKAYAKLAQSITVYVKKGLVDDENGTRYEPIAVSFNKNNFENIEENHKKTVELVNGNTATAYTSLWYDTSRVVLLSIPNEEVKDKYNLEVVKTKEDKQTRITEASFTVTKTEGTKTITLLNEASVDVNNGNVITDDIKIENSNQDIIEIEEVSVNDQYLGLGENVFVYVNKTFKEAEGKYVIDAAFDASDMTKKTKKVTLADGKTKLYVDLNLDSATKKITIIVPNKEIQGSYRLQIRKKDSKTNEGIGNIKFNVDITPKVGNNAGEVIHKTMTTSSKTEYLGQITSKNIPIEGQGKDEITITEVANLTNKYLELKNPLTLYVTKEVVNGKYKITAVSFEQNSVVTQLNNVPLSNDTSTVTVNAEIEGDIVRVIIPNEELTGSYGLKILKTGENDDIKLKDVKFNVTKTENSVEQNEYVIKSETTIEGEHKTETNGLVTILNNVDNPITEENVDLIDLYKITEADIANNPYVKIDDTITVYVHKKNMGNSYEVDRFSLEKITSSSQDVTEKGNIKLTKESDGIIKVTVKNEPLTGKYQLKIKKVNTKNTAIPGVNFKVYKKVNEAEDELETYGTSESTVTNSSGKVLVSGNNNAININESLNTITKESVGYIDEFKITEVSVDGMPYAKLKLNENEHISVFVKKGLVDDENGRRYEPVSIAFDSAANLGQNNQEEITKENVELTNGTKVTLKAKIYYTDEKKTRVILVSIPNEEVTTKYNLELVKIDAEDGSVVKGAVFTISNGETVDENAEPKETNNQGLISLPAVTVNKSNYSIQDAYTIHEVSADGSHVELAENITVYVNKNFDENTGMLSIIPSFNKVLKNNSTDTNKTVQLAENMGTVTATLNYDSVAGKITIQIPNKKVKGKYKVRIQKNDLEGNGIGNINFNVKITPKVGSTTGEVIEKNLTTYPKASYLGRITSDYINITGEGKDTIKITEIKDDTNKYLELQSALTLYVTKENINNSYKITNVSFSNSSIVTQKEVKLDDGVTKVNVQLEIVDGNIVKITIPNKEITGAYGLQIEKEGKTGETTSEALSGVKFNVDKNGTSLGENFTTGDDGIVTILNKEDNPINDEGVDEYTITETSVEDNPYIKLNENIKVYVKKKNNVKNYIVEKISLEPITDNSEVIHKKGNVMIDLIDDELIKLTVTNEPITGSYNLKIKKARNNTARTAIKDVSFAVTKNNVPVTTTPDKTGTDGKVTVESDNTINPSNAEVPDKFEITEINLNGKPYLKLKNPITLYVHKGIVGEEYKATSVSFEEGKIGSTEETINATIDNEDSNPDDDKIEVEIKAKIYSSYILLTIPNEPLTGKYQFKIRKFAEDGKTRIQGIGFEVKKNGTKVEDYNTSNRTTASDGKMTIKAEDNTYYHNITISDYNKVDKFTITEIFENGKPYAKLATPVNVYVKKDIFKNEFGKRFEPIAVSFTTAFKEGEEGYKATLEDVELENGTKVNLDAEIYYANENKTRVVLLTIPNEEIKDNYKIEVLKEKAEGGYINGAGFTITEGEQANKDSTVQLTSGNGTITLIEKELSQTTVDINNPQAPINQDAYTIREISSDDEHVEIGEDITVYVNKSYDAITKTFGCSVSFDKDDPTRKTKNVTYADEIGTVDVIASIDESTKTITIAVPNRKVEGEYKIRLQKNDSVTGKGIPNIKFNVNITPEVGGVQADVIKKEIITSSDKAYLGRKTSKPIKIHGEGTDEIEIIEAIDNNNTYIELRDPIKVYATKEKVGDEFKVTNLSFSKTEQTDLEQDVYLKDNTKVEVKAELIGDIVKVTMKNKPIEGSYGLQIKKNGQTDSVDLKDVVFNATKNNAPINKEIKTNVNGEATILTKEENAITGEGIDEYTITEANVGDNPYKVLDGEIKVYVQTYNAVNSFEVSRYSLSEISNDNEDVHELGNVKLTKSNDGIITVTVKNEPLTGKYQVKIKKVKEDGTTRIEGIGFKVLKNNTEVEKAPTVTNSEGRLLVKSEQNTNNHNITADNYKTIDEFNISEIYVNNMPYAKLSSPISVYIKKDIVDNENGRRLEPIAVSFDSSFSKGNVLKVTKENVPLENGNKVDVVAEIYHANENQTRVILVTIPNEEIKDKYKIEVLKEKEEGGYINGASFSITEGEQVNENSPGKETQGEGTVTLIEKELSQNTVNINDPQDAINQDAYTIREISSDDEHVEIGEDITLYVNKSYDKITKTFGCSVSFDKNDPTRTTKNVSYAGELGTTDVRASIDENTKTITIAVPNKKIEGEYKIRLQKNDSVTGKGIPNIKFNLNITPKVGNSQGQVIYKEMITSSDPDYYGRKTSKPIAITGEGMDEIEISEVKDDTNTYIELKDAVKVYATKKNVNGVYKVINVSFSNEENQEDYTKPIYKEVALLDDTKLNVKLELIGQIIKLTVQNAPITGSYGLKVKKTGEDNSKLLSGVTFEASKNGAVIGQNFITGNNGLVTIVDSTQNSITSEGTDVYTIKEKSLGNNPYKLSNEDINVYVHRKNTGDCYKVDRYSLSEIADNQADVHEAGNIKLEEVEDGIITITVKNEEITGKYNLELLKEKEDESAFPGVSFKVSKGEGTDEKTIIYGEVTNDDGKIVLPVETINKDGQDVYTIEELNVDSKYLKLAEPVKLYVNKKFSAEEEKYKVGVSFDESDISFENIDKTKNVQLEHEKGEVILVASLNEETGTITLRIPNKKVEGKYNFSILKTDNKTNEGLGGFKFNVKVTPKIGSTTGTIINKQLTTSSNVEDLGTARLDNIDIKGEGKDTIQITEVKDNTNTYLELNSTLTLYVTKTKENGEYIAKSVSFSSTSNKLDKEVYLNDGTTKVKVYAELIGNTVKVTVPNAPIEGFYGLKLKKLGQTEDVTLSGVVFSVAKKGASINKEFETDKDGEAIILDKANNAITEAGIDEFTITEESTGSNSYEMLTTPIKVYVEKINTGTSFKIERFSLREIKDTSEDVWEDGNVKLDLSDDGIITLTVKNEPIVGTYKFRIKKVVNGSNKVIPGIGFKVSKDGQNLPVTPNATDSAGKVYVRTLDNKEKHNITLDNSDDIDEFTILEINENSKPYAKLQTPLSVYIKKSPVDDANGKRFEATSISFDRNNFEEDKRETETDAILENGKMVKVKAKIWYETNRVILVTIPNEEIKGKYSLEVLKTKEENGEGIEGVSFKVVKGEEIPEGIEDTFTNSDGKIILPEEEVNEENESIIDAYTIREVSSDNEHIEINEDVTVFVRKKYNPVSKKFDISASFDKNNANAVTKLVPYAEELGTAELSVSASQETGRITLNIPNKKVEGKYKFRVQKNNIKTGKGIPGITFNLKIIPKVGDVAGDPINKTLVTSKGSDSLGRKTTEYINIEGEGTDEIEIKEVSDDTNAYIELKDAVKVYATKKNVNGVYKVTGLSFSNEANQADYTEPIEKEVELLDGTKVNVKLELIGQMIKLTVPNAPITGAYGMKLVKLGEGETENLGGVRFNVSKIGSATTQNFETNSDGEVTIVNIANNNITGEGIDEYTITEENAGKNPYKVLAGDIKVYVQKVNDGTSYKVGRYSLSPIEGTQEDVLEKDNVKLDIDEDGIISIKVNDEPLTGDYILKIKKVQTDTEETPISGVSFGVLKNGTEVETDLEVTGTAGLVKVLSDNTITKDNYTYIDEFKITEVNVNDKPYVKLQSAISLFVKKDIVDDANGRRLEPVSISFNRDDMETNKTYDDIEGTLENGETVTVRARLWNDINRAIVITIPNEEIKGKYSLEVLKTREENGSALSGATFTVTKGKVVSSGEHAGEETDVETVIDRQVTNGEGKVSLPEEIEINQKNVDEKDVYTIKENSSAEDHIKISEEVKIYVSKTFNPIERKYRFSVSFDKDKLNDTKKKIKISEELGEVELSATINRNTGVITVEVPNKKITGSYGLELVKLGEEVQPGKEEDKLAGVKFNVTKSGSTTSKSIETNDDGEATIVDITNNPITEEGIDEYTITEESVGTNPYKMLEGSIKVYVQKVNDGTSYKVGRYSLSPIEGTTRDVTENGNVKLAAESGIITITVRNDKITGKFDLELVKIDQKDEESVLPGVTFDIKAKVNETEAKLYDINDKEINTKCLTTDTKGKIIIPNVKITEGAKYEFEITETKVPNGYVMLKDPIKLIFNSVFDQNLRKYVLINTTLKGLAEAKAESNKITVTIKNGQFDLALRKFANKVIVNAGTDKEKSVELQDRVPVFKVDKDGNYTYEHSKETILLGSENLVEYTLRVYNEGSISGYAKEIKDDIPEGLIFLPNNETNKEFGWKLLDAEGNEVKEVNKAKYIVTNYLSKEAEKVECGNLIKAFNTKEFAEGKVTEPYYKDIKVVFKVTMPNTDDRIVINKAQISDDSDESGDDITDKDSTTNEWIDGEDDQDTESLKVKTFDLSLRKWITDVITIKDGHKEKIATGHKAEDDPEQIVKVDLKDSEIDDVIVKFAYKIRVKNEGELAGYAKEISDYIPEGLRFDADDNPGWKEDEGKVVTEELKNKLLKPDETAEVEVILTWINQKDNLGLKQNIAEITKDYNVLGSPDVDSTPGNKVQGEDDIDDAKVLLTVKTGKEATYVELVIAILAIAGFVVIFVKKYSVKE